MSDLFIDPKVLWFLVGLALIGAEFVIPGLTLIFFGIGALITAVCLYLFPLSFIVQVCLFLFCSVAGLLLFRSRIKTALFSPGIRFRNIPSSLQSEIFGVEVDVIEAVAPPRLGRVLLHGTSWQARAANAVSKGARVRITGREGLVLVVEELQ